MMNITIRHQRRKSVALQLTQSGAVVLLPHGVNAESEAVQTFVTTALAKVPTLPSVAESATADQIYELVVTWSARLEVSVTRIQIRVMQNKWGSISTAGTLTLASDLLALPLELIEYVIVHELLHLKFPDHRRGWQVSMGIYLADWREREAQLQVYTARF